MINSNDINSMRLITNEDGKNNGCSLYIDIVNFSQCSNDRKKEIALEISRKGLQIKSYIFGFNEKAINNSSIYTATIKKIINAFSKFNSQLEIISIGKISEKFSDDDMLFYYNDSLKS